ncbi:hypothetical protein BDW59DRAFT_121366 [Aspergillus cavernicola]|uniref:Uncharacterized protein n=1 Tax=Aspergillus cavernicola TaxID=176166 RepID=A0ABR4HV04_9EURO
MIASCSHCLAATKPTIPVYLAWLIPESAIVTRMNAPDDRSLSALVRPVGFLASTCPFTPSFLVKEPIGTAAAGFLPYSHASSLFCVPAALFKSGHHMLAVFQHQDGRLRGRAGRIHRDSIPNVAANGAETKAMVAAKLGQEHSTRCTKAQIQILSLTFL